MMLMCSLSAGLLMLSFIMILVSFLIGKKTDKDREKLSPFECGFDPVGSGRLAFSLQFYMIAIIFMVFDVEVCLLFPLTIANSSSSLLVWSSMGVLFLLILLIGVYHEWHEGALDWKN